MKKDSHRDLDVDAVARAKREARAADARALASGEMDVEALRRRNSLFHGWVVRRSKGDERGEV